MRFNRKIIFSTCIIVAVAAYYFLTHYPVGTFRYSKQNSNDLNIKIRVSESLGAFQEPVYNMHLTFEKNEKLYTKSYQTSDNLIFFAVLNRNGKEFIVFNDFWKGYSKCENGNCEDFFNIEDISYSVDNSTNDTTYFKNYSDTLKADTLSYVEFKDFKFKKLK